MSDWYWSIPFWALGAVIAWRLIRAPFVIWREDQQQIAALTDTRDAVALKTQRRERIGQYLSESRTLLGRARKADDDPTFEAEVQEWANGLGDYLTAEFGESYVTRLQHSRKGWQYSGGKDESRTAPFLERANENLGVMLDELSV